MNGRAVGGAILAVVALAFLACVGKLIEVVGPDEIAVIQHPLSGELTWYTTPGPKWQGFGEVTIYQKRGKYAFLDKNDGREVRFVDGGHGTLTGMIQYELPLDSGNLGAIHAYYRSLDRLESDVIKTATNNAIYLTGSLMSSAESYAAKRPDLVRLVLDQVQNGVYQTRQTTEWIVDPTTNERKQVTKAEIVMEGGKPLRQEPSTLTRFGIKAFQFQIDRLYYSPEVEAQIKTQQELTMRQTTSATEARMAEQAALTNEAQGRANAAKSKWEQETIKAREVTKAEQEKEVQVTNAKRDKEVAETQAAQRFAVAQFEHKAAEETKQQQILLGQGEAERKKLVIEADGALEQKLAVYERTVPKIFEALRGTAFVPQISMGAGQGGGKDASALPLIDLLTAKVAKDIAVDMSMKGK